MRQFRNTLKTARRLVRRQLWPRWVKLATLAATICVLRLLGRSWLCQCGQLRLWVADAYSAHTSQHLADPYSFTHLQHGLVLYWLVRWIVPKWKWPWQFWLVLTVECGWEILENTPQIINRYRDATAALGYTGDTIINSAGDILACAIGALAAQRLGWRRTWLLFVAIEVALLLTIRDSLLLNVLMLLTPLEAVKQWQMQVAACFS